MQSMHGGTVIIADDHPLMRRALRDSVVQACPDADVQEVADMESLMTLVSRLAEGVDGVDLVLLDLSMPGMMGLGGLVALRAQHPEIPVVIVSATEDAKTMRRSLACGASGFIPKSTSEETIVLAVRCVIAGESWVPDVSQGVVLGGSDDGFDPAFAERVQSLTPQQVRVLAMITEGRLNKQIAYDLGVTEATVKAHVTQILRKLGVVNRTQAVIAAGRLGIGRVSVEDTAGSEV